MTASGTFGYGLEFADFVPLDGIGGIIVKGTTLHAREGNDYPRMVETPKGMLNCVGLQNKGVDYFCDHIYPSVKDIDTNIIVNVSGSTPEDYAECAARINALDHIPAIELNISCPNVKNGGMAFGVTPEGAAAVVKAVRARYDKVLIVKLSPNRDRHHQHCQSLRGRGRRRRLAHQHPFRHVDRHRAPRAATEHPHGRTERPCRQTRRRENGL